MPHIVVEYSNGLENQIDVPQMLSDMHASLGQGLGGTERIKTRAVKLDHAVIGDKGADANMIHITLLLLEGRDGETKKAYSKGIYDAANKAISDLTPYCAVTFRGSRYAKGYLYFVSYSAFLAFKRLAAFNLSLI